MPKKMIFVFLALFLLYGCESSKTPPAAIKIDKINITTEEFEDAFKNSPYATENSEASRKEFLNNYVTRLLILKEAEKVGLDKEPSFLKNVQFFWQQSLIKMMLDRKIKDLSTSIRVTDSEIKTYYDSHKESEFKDKELSSVYEKIKWLVLNDKQKKSMDAWLNSVKGASRISIDYKLLKINK